MENIRMASEYKIQDHYKILDWYHVREILSFIKLSH